MEMERIFREEVRDNLESENFVWEMVSTFKDEISKLTEILGNQFSFLAGDVLSMVNEFSEKVKNIV